jgi:hypothetical protein
MVALADNDGTVELMDGPGNGKPTPARLRTALRFMGAEVGGGSPFPLLRGDADELHLLLAKLKETQSTPDGASSLAEVYAFLSSLPGFPEDLREEWEVLAGGRAHDEPTQTIQAAAPSPVQEAPPPPPQPVPSQEATQLAGWEARLKAWEDRLNTQQNELEEVRRVTEEKQSYLAQLDKTLRTKETSSQKWDARLKDLEATLQKERARTNDLMKNLETLQTHLTSKEQDLNAREVELVKREEALATREANLGATEQALYAKARETVLKEFKEEQEKIAHEGEMVNIWRQALSAKEQELEERMRALEEERKRMTKGRRSKGGES